MGASLAQVYALAGWSVSVYSRSEKGLEKGRHLIDVNQQTLVEKKIITAEQSAVMKKRLTFTAAKRRSPSSSG